jgi:choline dehydrogenase-like flavoprotein
MACAPDVSYDVVIGGSGFGGSICANRLALAGLKVLVLEYGYQPQVPLLTVLLHPGRYGLTRKTRAGLPVLDPFWRRLPARCGNGSRRATRASSASRCDRARVSTPRRLGAICLLRGGHR